MNTRKKDKWGHATKHDLFNTDGLTNMVFVQAFIEFYEKGTIKFLGSPANKSQIRGIVGGLEITIYKEK